MSFVSVFDLFSLACSGCSSLILVVVFCLCFCLFCFFIKLLAFLLLSQCLIHLSVYASGSNHFFRIHILTSSLLFSLFRDFVMQFFAPVASYYISLLPFVLLISLTFWLYTRALASARSLFFQRPLYKYSDLRKSRFSSSILNILKSSVGYLHDKQTLKFHENRPNSFSTTIYRKISVIDGSTTKW